MEAATTNALENQETETRLRVLSLFPSCGGFDLGFVRAGGFEIVRAIEPDDSAARSYKTNIPCATVERAQPRAVEYELHEADVIIGIPPCPETANLLNMLAMSKVVEPTIVDINDPSTGTTTTTAATTSLLSSSDESDNEDGDGNVNNNDVDTGKRAVKRRKCTAQAVASALGLGNSSNTTTVPVAATKRKRKVARRSRIISTVDVSASRATACNDNALDMTGESLAVAMREAGCIVKTWPIDAPPARGRPFWWCSWVYYRRYRQRTRVRLCNDPDIAYDADTENEGDDNSSTSSSTSTSDEDGDGDADMEMVGAAATSSRNDQRNYNEVPRRRRKCPRRACCERGRGAAYFAESESASLPLHQPSEPPDPPIPERVYDDDSIFDFMRTVGRVQPMVFAMVLPPKVIEHTAMEPLFNEIARIASLYNYVLDGIVLDASEFGVPQTRRRAFLIGRNRSCVNIREASDLVHDRVFIGPRAPRVPPVSAGSVLRSMPEPGTGANTGVCKAKVIPTRNTIRGLRGSAYAGQIFNGGGRPIDLQQPCNTFSRYIGGNYTPIVDQAHIDDPTVEPWYETYFRALKTNDTVALQTLKTVPAHVRRLTVTEAKVLTGFHIDFELCGSHSAQFRQVGSACAPPVAERVAQYIKSAVNK